MFLPAGIFLRWVEQHIKAIITAEEVMFNSFPPSDCLSCKKVPFGLGGGGGGTMCTIQPSLHLLVSYL